MKDPEEAEDRRFLLLKLESFFSIMIDYKFLSSYPLPCH